MIPLVTVMAPLTIYIIVGSLVIEQIFAVPGIGEQFVQSVLVNDYSMILGTTIFFSVLFISRPAHTGHHVRDHRPQNPRRRSEGVGHGDPISRA